MTPLSAEDRAQRRWARQQTLNAINRGDLVRPDRCLICQRKGFTQAHHPDYSKPLHVEFLCNVCHTAIHRHERRVAAGERAAQRMAA